MKVIVEKKKSWFSKASYMMNSVLYPQVFPTPQYYMLRLAQQFICSCFSEPEHVNIGSVPEGTNIYQV